MDLNGAIVLHKKYGQGIIKDVQDKYIIIEYNGVVKKFAYPDAFKLGLKPIDKDIETFIKNEVEAKDENINNYIKIGNEIIEEKVYENNSNSEFFKSENIKYFFVFQNKSFSAERRGGYLWAPKLNFDGRKVSHWVMMEEVRKGDIILHCVNKNIIAISIAESDCYFKNQPEELKREQLWEDDGYMVDCKYIDIKNPIMTSDYKDEILKLQPSKYGPFNSLGRGNTGYLFASNKKLTEFIIEKSVYANPYLNELKYIFE